MTPQEMLIEKQDELIKGLYEHIDILEKQTKLTSESNLIKDMLIQNLTTQVVILKAQNIALMSVGLTKQ